MERDHRRAAAAPLGARLQARPAAGRHAGDDDRGRLVGRHQLQHAMVVGDRRHRSGHEEGARRLRRQPEAHRAVPALHRLGGRHVAQPGDRR